MRTVTKETGFLKKPGFLIASKKPGFFVAGAILLVSSALAAQDGGSAAGPRLYVTAAAASLIDQGLALGAPTGTEAAAFQSVPSPIVRNVQNAAMATTAPWIDANAWRFARGMQKAAYSTLPPGAAPLAAAEAFAFNVDAILNPPAEDVAELGNMLRFLRTHAQAPMTPLANIGVVDSTSPLMDEILNMLARRNLLYRVVSKPDRSLDLTVELGSPDFPLESAANPSDFAARVRAALGDDKRLVRLYGTSAVIARLTGEGSRARLVLLNFSRNRNQQNAQAVRARVLGRYRVARFGAYGAAAGAALEDVQNPGNATEFTLPAFSTIAIIDLEATR